MVPWAFQQPGTQSMIESSYSHEKDFPFILGLRIRSGTRKESYSVQTHGGSSAVVGQQNEGLEMVLARYLCLEGAEHVGDTRTRVLEAGFSSGALWMPLTSGKIRLHAIVRKRCILTTDHTKFLIPLHG